MDEVPIPKLPFQCVGDIGSTGGRESFQGSAKERLEETKAITFIKSGESAKKLEALGFDPIAKLVERYGVLEDRIETELLKSRPSMILIGQLETLLQKCASDLLRYGYSRVSETSVVKNENPASFIINTIPTPMEGKDVDDKDTTDGEPLKKLNGVPNL